MTLRGDVLGLLLGCACICAPAWGCNAFDDQPDEAGFIVSTDDRIPGRNGGIGGMASTGSGFGTAPSSRVCPSTECSMVCFQGCLTGGPMGGVPPTPGARPLIDGGIDSGELMCGESLCTDTDVVAVPGLSAYCCTDEDACGLSVQGGPCLGVAEWEPRCPEVDALSPFNATLTTCCTAGMCGVSTAGVRCTELGELADMLLPFDLDLDLPEPQRCDGLADDGDAGADELDGGG